MTIDEIMRRIIRAHLNTILVCTLLPLALVFLIELKTPQTFTAQVRLQTEDSAPGSSTEADGLSGRVLALATTPAVVQQALRTAGQPASSSDALTAARHNVTAERLGESSVVVLSVLADDQQAASRTVSALADRVITFMNNGSRHQFDATMSAAKAAVTTARARRDRLQADLLTTNGLQARANLQTMLSTAQRDLDQAETQQAALVLSDVERDNVVAIDAGSPTVDPVPSALVPRSALALLLGLLTGLALAVTQETLRPRIAGIRVVARALDAPILGATGQRRAALAAAMSLAARRQGVETVVLVGVDDRDEKMTRQLLQEMVPGWQEEIASPAPVTATAKHRAAERVAAAADGRRAPEPTVTLSSQVRFTDRYGVTPAEEPTAGVVVVSAGTARRSSLDQVQDMVRAMRWPVVGVVEVTPRRSWLVSQ